MPLVNDVGDVNPVAANQLLYVLLVAHFPRQAFVDRPKHFRNQLAIFRPSQQGLLPFLFQAEF